MPDSYDVIVIGTGIAGLAAARQALREGLKTATIEGLFFGGLVTNVNELDGEPAGSGSDVSAGLMMEVTKLGSKSLTANATGIEADGAQLVVKTDAGDFRSRAVIVASGARLKRLGVPGESELEEKGVSHCADCDGPFYQGQEVVVVGGGDSALQEALVLSDFAKTVHLVHRGAGFRAKPSLIDRVAARPNIAVRFNTEVEAVLGDDAVRAVKLEGGEELSCTGIFAYVGLEPASEFLPGGVSRDAAGLVETGADFQTGMPGVFAAGAVRSGYGGMLAHAIAEGEAAARSAAAHLKG